MLFELKGGKFMKNVVEIEKIEGNQVVKCLRISEVKFLCNQ